jgi:hypothetical protein
MLWYVSECRTPRFPSCVTFLLFLLGSSHPAFGGIRFCLSSRSG